MLVKQKSSLIHIYFYQLIIFYNISFGGCERNVYGATPVEILHAVLLRLCEYIAEGTEMMFTTSGMDLISDVTVGIYEDSRRQIEHDLPDLGPF